MFHPWQLPDNDSFEEQIEDLRMLIAQQSRDIHHLETEVAELKHELSDFEASYERIVKPISNQLEAVKHAINKLEDLYLKSQMGDQVPIETLWRNARQRRAENTTTPPDIGADLPSARPPRNLNLKQLYRDLARTYHPDLAINETDREDRTRLMAIINQAYRDGDAETLHELFNVDNPDPNLNKSYQPDDAPKVARMPLEKMMIRQLQEQCLILQRQLDDLKRERSDLRYGMLMDLKIEATIAQAEGRDLLTEIARDMESDYWEHIKTLDELRAGLPNTASTPNSPDDPFNPSDTRRPDATSHQTSDDPAPSDAG